MIRLLTLITLLAVTGLAQAFSIDELSQQLGKPTVVRGPFIQEKHLRALPVPLTSKGNFVLAKANGLLWLLSSPVQQDYRIDARGIARRDPGGWQVLPSRGGGAEQNQLFFAVLQGDSRQLQKDFELALQGDAQHWTLQLTPRSLLLKQIFTRIDISGGEYVERIQLAETQGDSTVLRMTNSTSSSNLSAAERADFAQ